MTSSDSEARGNLTYHQEDIQEILQIAIARQAYEGEFSREQLLEIADELEISLETLQQAEREWISRKGELQQRQAFNIYRSQKLKKHVGNYTIVNSFFVLLDLISSSTLDWSLYIVLFWGLKLGLDTWNTYHLNSEEYERSFQNWNRRHQIKQTINTFLNKWIKA